MDSFALCKGSEPGLGMVIIEVPTSSPELPIDTLVPFIVAASPPMDKVMLSATTVPEFSGVNVCPAATIPILGVTLGTWAGCEW